MIKNTTTCLLSSVHCRTDILDFNYFYRNTDHHILVSCYLLKVTSETEGCPGTCPLLPHLPTFAHNQLLNQEPSAFSPGLYRLNYHHPTSVKKKSQMEMLRLLPAVYGGQSQLHPGKSPSECITARHQTMKHYIWWDGGKVLHTQ